MTPLEKRVGEIRRKRALQNRLNKLRLRYFDHEDAGLADKHNRLVNRLTKAIISIQ
jgi:hypothetical protein